MGIRVLSYSGMGGLLIRQAAPGIYDFPDVWTVRTRKRSMCSCTVFSGRTKMLKYAIIFAIISLIAGALGFGGIAAGSAGIAKILFGLFLILAVVFVVLAALGVGAAKKVLK